MSNNRSIGYMQHYMVKRTQVLHVLSVQGAAAPGSDTAYHDLVFKSLKVSVGIYKVFLYLQVKHNLSGDSRAGIAKPRKMSRFTAQPGLLLSKTSSTDFRQDLNPQCLINWMSEMKLYS